MSWEINLLRVMSERQYFQEFKQLTNMDILGDGAQECLTVFGGFFAMNPATNRVDYQSIVQWMGAFMKPKNDEQETAHHLRCSVFQKVFSDSITESMIEDTRTQIVALCFAEDASSALVQFNSGMLQEDLLNKFDEYLIKYSDMARSTHLSPIRKDIEEILREQDDMNGLTLPLDGLNKTVAPLKAGDFVVVGAQNNTGKTAFAVQCAVHFARQLPEDAKILYLNNEGIGDHIILRARQIALDLPKDGLETAFKSGFPIEEDYRKEINGDSYKIEVIDVHGINVSQVKSLMRLHKPDVIIYDMPDAIHGFGGGGMDVDRYKQLYSWLRAQCANPEHRHIGMGLTQVSHDGHGEVYVPKHALEGSKVAKQAQSDVLIMIGMDEKMPANRYIWTPRCKRTRKGATESGSRFMTGFDQQVGKYLNTGTSYVAYEPEEEEEAHVETNDKAIEGNEEPSTQVGKR